MRLAVLDIGSNTAHLTVVDGQPDGTFNPIAEQRAVLNLAEAAFPAMILPDDAAARLIQTVGKMRAFSPRSARTHWWLSRPRRSVRLQMEWQSWAACGTPPACR